MDRSASFASPPPDQPIAFAKPDITEREIDAVVQCLRGGWLTTGSKCQQFEAAFADALGVKHALAVSSATMGALLLMDAIGVGPGWDVFVPAYTFSGPPMMAHKLGASLRFVDIGPDCYQMDPARLQEEIARSSAIQKLLMPTHFAGEPCDMNAILHIAKENGCYVIDDAAHALPTRDDSGRLVGSQGADATFFSFYATKTLTSGEGGMIVTANDAIAAKVASLRSHGFSRESFDRYTNPARGWFYDVAAAGWKANMTDIAAAIGLVQLGRLEETTQKRRELASRYRKELSGIAGLSLPPAHKGHCWHLFPVQVSGDRDGFIRRMASAGVHCSVHFIPLHLHSFWQREVGCPGGHLPNTERMFAHEASLPIYSQMTSCDALRVISTVQASVASNRGTGEA